jgi:hypothetical protein
MLAHVFLWEYSYKMLKLAQLLGQLGVVLTPGMKIVPVCRAADKINIGQFIAEAQTHGFDFGLYASSLRPNKSLHVVSTSFHRKCICELAELTRSIDADVVCGRQVQLLPARPLEQPLPRRQPRDDPGAGVDIRTFGWREYA